METELPPPQKGGHSPQFSAHVYCGQTVCSVCLSVCGVGVLWPNGWMDQDETWYGGRPRTRAHVVVAGSPSNTMWPGPRPTAVPSCILIHPTVWPQHTNVADRQDRQRSDSIGRTVLQTVAQKLNLYLL